MIEKFGPMSVVMVLAHEYGHAIQQQSGIVSEDDPGIVFEQQADCFAGAFMRHVAEDEAEHFTINTSDGLNSVLAATVSIRDSDPNDPESVHGSAFERVTAVQIGFTDGPEACTRIDEAEIARPARRPTAAVQLDRATPENSRSPRTRSASSPRRSGVIFPDTPPPTIDFSDADTGCTNARTTRPVSYCPATNTIGVDVPALAERGTPQAIPRNGLPLTVTGDYNAYVLLRVALHPRRAAASGPVPRRPATALRAACLSGVFTAGLATDRGPDAGDFMLSPGDLDEAVSGLLTDGLAASDANGRTVPSGFSRVDAFRTGVLGGEDACTARYGGPS